ncbi:tyrosine-type recombinase/integrase [Streptomyces platensis]|uniref:tyrosine-type recombinase/integrase n=1 Tax=Streptomyces platensis TaxID=58346 RepID=UPI003C2B04BF
MSLRRIRFHDFRHSTATLLLEQGVELVVIKEFLGHAHIGVTATVYAHVRLRLQRDAIDALGTTLVGRRPRDGTLRQRRTATVTVRLTCPLTLPSTTAVKCP